MSENLNIVDVNFVSTALSEDDKVFLEKIGKVSSFFSSKNSDEQPVSLQMSLSDGDLVEKYGFTEQECKRLREYIAAVTNFSEKLSGEHIPDGYKIHISHTDLIVGGCLAGLAYCATGADVAGLLAAAGEVVGGVVEEAVAKIIALVGKGTLFLLVAVALKAVATNRGMYIQFQLSSDFFSYGCE